MEQTDGRTPHSRFFLQLVPEPKTVKNRMHTTLADPEGNEFCLMR
jgi:hypothetical protein